MLGTKRVMSGFAGRVGKPLGIGLLWLGLMSAANAVPVPVGPGVVLPDPSFMSGLNSRWVEVADANTPHSITDALNILSGATPSINEVNMAVSVIDFDDASVPLAGADPKFAVEYTGYLNLLGAVTGLQLGANHDDGFRLTLGGEIIAEFPNDTPPTQTLSAVLDLGPGLYELSFVSWEQGGAFENEFIYTFDGGKNTYLVPEGVLVKAVPEPATLTLLSLSLIGLGVMGRRRSGATRSPA